MRGVDTLGGVICISKKVPSRKYFLKYAYSFPLHKTLSHIFYHLILMIISEVIREGTKIPTIFKESAAQILICLKPLDWTWKQNPVFLILDVRPCPKYQGSKGRVIT